MINHLFQALRRASLGRDDAPFLYDNRTGDTLTYGAFFENAAKMSGVLHDLGLTPGDRVAVQAPKTIAMLELYVGTIMVGGVFLPLNPAYTPAEVSYFLGDAKPLVFVCDPDDEATLTAIAKETEVAHLLTLGADETGTLTNARNVAPPALPVARSPDDLAAILYTSGTTGRSKGAMLSHGALTSNSDTLRKLWRFTENDVLIHALPIFHTHGLFVATNITLMAGGAAIFMPSFDANAIMDALPKATALMGVPTFYTRLLDQPDLAEQSRNMRLFVSGSAPLLTETHERWQRVTGHAILERYGMTETNMTTSNPYDGDRRAGTVGFPLPEVDVKVCDPETGATLKQGEIGVLEVRGPNVFSGYWNLPEKTAEELREDGFFITGDLARINADGYFQIVGRSKDLIISGGLNIYPKEIESAIDDLPGVLESAVIGVPHPDFGEGVVAVVVAEPDTQISPETIASNLGDMARFKQPKHIVIVDALPRNSMGKVQKNILRDTYANVLS